MQNQENQNHIPEGFRDETDLIMFIYRDLKGMRKEFSALSDTVKVKQEDVDKILLDYQLLKARLGAYFLAANAISGVIGFVINKLLA